MGHLSASDFCKTVGFDPEEAYGLINNEVAFVHYFKYSSGSIYACLNKGFLKSSFANKGRDFDEAVHIICPAFFANPTSQEDLVESFLRYCEMIAELVDRLQPGQIGSDLLPYLKQTLSTVDNELLLMGFKLHREGPTFRCQTINPKAEAVGVSLPPDESRLVFDYLCSRSKDDKRKALTMLANLVEKQKKKISSTDGILKQIGEYVQLFRHYDENKDKLEYSWFYHASSESAFYDPIFDLFICVLSYASATETLADLETKKSVFPADGAQ